MPDPLGYSLLSRGREITDCIEKFRLYNRHSTPEQRSVYPQLFHLIVPVTSDIQSVADLKGKRVGTPAAGGSSYAAFMLLIKHYDLQPQDFAAFKNLKTAELIDGLTKGDLDAVFGAPADGPALAEGFAIGHPAGP